MVSEMEMEIADEPGHECHYVDSILRRLFDSDYELDEEARLEVERVKRGTRVSQQRRRTQQVDNQQLLERSKKHSKSRNNRFQNACSTRRPKIFKQFRCSF